MNRKVTILSLALSAFFFTASCDRELDQNSYEKVNDELAFTSPENFTGALLSSYGTGRLIYSGDTGNQLAVPDLFTDNLIYTPQSRGSNRSAWDWNITPTNGSVTSIYTQAYLAVNRANTPLKFINNLPAGSFRTNIEAEARALRALWHFDIVRAYAKIPTQSADANASLGIAYLEKFEPEIYTSRNLNVGQVYTKIVADLEYAAENLTTTSSDKGRFTKNAALGLLSRVYLYMGEYQKAVTVGQQVIASTPDVGNISDFAKIWNADSPNGVLLKFLNSNLEKITTGVAFQQALAQGIRPEFTVEKGLYDLYKDTDVRKNSYIKSNSLYNGQLSNVVIKYQNAGQGRPDNVVDVKYLRTAEVYLNVAEAAYRSGNTALALTTLNTLRQNRYTDYVAGTESGQALLDAILKERRLELAFETDRFYTLKRLGLPVERTDAGPYADGSGPKPNNLTLPATSNLWQWPIPQSQININADLKQNPGY